MIVVAADIAEVIPRYLNNKGHSITVALLADLETAQSTAGIYNTGSWLKPGKAQPPPGGAVNCPAALRLPGLPGQRQGL
ncbi:hypothetical protein NB069_16965 [Leclercia adecarboxylata]|uniref:hypothetical protein n=1 Tax=Leclercia adecarboxylata TaxID=83655 RepID=UPI002029C78A|nr:hypothetical protein [Leclercia adecarboxylata]URN98344.1 hypothetical protein NB069_16965 [Leclercia adecarboxylata]